MTRKTVEKAREVLCRHPDLIFPIDIELLAVEEGCELITWPFLLPVKEVKRGRWIGVAAGLEPNERRYLVAHALAHHLMHTGNQLVFHDIQKATLWKQEREAEECAAHILIPEVELSKIGTLSVWELAECFRVPAELARKRVIDFATESELSRWELLDLREE